MQIMGVPGDPLRTISSRKSQPPAHPRSFVFQGITWPRNQGGRDKRISESDERTPKRAGSVEEDDEEERARRGATRQSLTGYAVTLSWEYWSSAASELARAESSSHQLEVPYMAVTRGEPQLSSRQLRLAAALDLTMLRINSGYGKSGIRSEIRIPFFSITAMPARCLVRGSISVCQC